MGWRRKRRVAMTALHRSMIVGWLNMWRGMSAVSWDPVGLHRLIRRRNRLGV
jgi:hypothetical protein